MHVEAERLRARRRMLLALSLERRAAAGGPGAPSGADERGPSVAATAAAEGRRPSEAA
jgi:hypothetical protein